MLMIVGKKDISFVVSVDKLCLSKYKIEVVWWMIGFCVAIRKTVSYAHMFLWGKWL